MPATLLDRTVPMIRDTSNLIQEIAAASQEQMAAIREINVGVSQLEEVVQQNAAASHQLSATATGLASQSSTCSEQVDFFQIDTSGNGGGPVGTGAQACARTPGRRCERSTPGQAAPGTGPPGGPWARASDGHARSARAAGSRSSGRRRPHCPASAAAAPSPPPPSVGNSGTSPRGGVW